MMDFTSPLSENGGFNLILTITDHLFPDIWIIPCSFNISVDDLTVWFFEHWYCKNGVLLNIVSDCDKLFLPTFWCALTRPTGVKLKILSTYHPETNGVSG